MADKPNVVTLTTAAGREFKLLLCIWGLYLAEEVGFDITKLDVDKDGAEKRVGSFGPMLEMLWVAALPYEDTLTLKEMGLALSFHDLGAMTAAFQKVTSRQMSDDVVAAVQEAKGGNEGKGRRSASPSPA